MSTSRSDSIIVALDCDRTRALVLAKELRGRARWLKVGMTLFYAEGPSIVHDLRELGFSLFIDLKLHDIPHQVNGAARSLASLGAEMITMHAAGGTEMLMAGVEGARQGAADAGVNAPAMLAVTVLTSMDEHALASIGVLDGSALQVPRLARLASDAGCDGVVCSPVESRLMSEMLPKGSYVVTPGVRPAGSVVGDQARISTPVEAIAAGSTHLVIGRPITDAADPLRAFDEICREVEGIL